MTVLLPGMPLTYGAPMPAMGMSPMGMSPMGMSPMGMPPMGMSPYGVMPRPVYISSLNQLPPGAVPISQQMLAQALGQSTVGAQVVQDKPSVMGSMLKGAGIGAAAGAAFGIIPFLPLGLFSGALVGAGVGAAIGLAKGLVGKTQENEFHVMSPEQQQAAAMAQMAAATPAGARS